MEVLNNFNSPESLPLTTYERKINDFRKTQCDKELLKLQDSIANRLKESSLGIFLYHLNKVQTQWVTIQQDKLDRVKFDIDKQLINLKLLERRNDICDNLFQLIHELLEDNPSGTITSKYTLQHMKFLRLSSSKVTTMDKSLQSLSGLQALVMAGNCLSSVPGHYLPRGLLLLELCCNKLQDISSLLETCPPQLLYLGLARNYLTQENTALLSLAQNLFHLDLAHNDIEDLQKVVSACAELNNLSSLLLVGNPCSMTESYVLYIIHELPKLIFLDCIMLKKQCEDLELEKKDDLLTGSLQITLYRILSLPQPSNEKINKKKVLHSFRIEVDCSLLKPYQTTREEFFVEDPLMKKDQTIPEAHRNSKEKKKGKKKSVGGSKTKGSIQKDKTKDAKSKEKSNEKKRSRSKNKNSTSPGVELEEVNVYEEMLKTDTSDLQPSFVSDRKTWGKIMEFSDPSVEINNCDLFTLRNIFRSNLTLRLVHFKTLPPDVKKRKKSSKTKKQKKESKSSEEVNNEQNTKEILVNKAIVAKVVMPLQDIFWNMKSLDYCWSKSNPFKTELSLGLKELQYSIKKKKKEPKSQKGKAKKDSTELQLPPVLTIHIGVGVKRLQTENLEFK